jgi:hypothetical protein
MTGTPLPNIAPMRPEPERNRWGQYVLPDANGTKRGWSRATTLAHAISDQHHLGQWKRRMVLQGLAHRPDLTNGVLDLVGDLDSDNVDARKSAKDILDGICDDAADAAGANRGSSLGTLLHLITEYADAGRLSEIEAQIPAELLRDLDAYREALHRNGITTPPAWIERIVVNPAVDSAGTIDRIVNTTGSDLPIIGDLKTQKTVSFGFLEIGIQLAEYANAESMWDEDAGQLIPMPEVRRDYGLVFHLPVGTARCTVYEIDLEAGWRAAQLAHQVRLARKATKDMGRPYRPAAAQVADDDTRVLYLIRNAPHPESLVAIWRDRASRGLAWTAEMNQAATTRKAELAAVA